MASKNQKIKMIVTAFVALFILLFLGFIGSRSIQGMGQSRFPSRHFPPTFNVSAAQQLSLGRPSLQASMLYIYLSLTTRPNRLVQGTLN
jgi:hypothetical protein